MAYSIEIAPLAPPRSLEVVSEKYRVRVLVGGRGYSAICDHRLLVCFHWFAAGRQRARCACLCEVSPKADQCTCLDRLFLAPTLQSQHARVSLTALGNTTEGGNYTTANLPGQFSTHNITESHIRQVVAALCAFGCIRPLASNLKQSRSKGYNEDAASIWAHIRYYPCPLYVCPFCCGPPVVLNWLSFCTG